MVGDSPRRPVHLRPTLLALHEGRGIGYELDGVTYGLVWPGAGEPGEAEATRVALLHAAALDLRQVEVQPPTPVPAESPGGMGFALSAQAGDPARALQAARLALALARLADGQSLSAEERGGLCQEHGPPTTREVILHADGSADKGDGSLSVGYTLNGRPYAALLGERGHEYLAEREAIRLALTHARLLGYERFRVLSDHRFHVRRYAENLVHRGRRKSGSLERLDALVDDLGPAVSFEYTGTSATDAPHRLAVHARALHRLALGQSLSRSQAVALRRVHFARRVGGGVLY